MTIQRCNPNTPKVAIPQLESLCVRYQFSKRRLISSKADGVPDAIFIATGSELQLALHAQELLRKEGRKKSLSHRPAENQPY